MRKRICHFFELEVRIPTATTFMRFLYPNDFGVMDSRVVGNHTQPNGITTLSLRNDGYINDTKQNIIKYETEYIIFLRVQAASLNKLGIKFRMLMTGKYFINISFFRYRNEFILNNNFQ